MMIINKLHNPLNIKILHERFNNITNTDND